MSPNLRFRHEVYKVIEVRNKTKGDPEIIEKGTLTFNFPTQLATDSYFNLPIKIKNLGQGWWDKDANYYLSLDIFPKELYSFSPDFYHLVSQGI